MLRGQRYVSGGGGDKVDERQGDANQNGLHLCRGTFGLVHEHLLGDVFPPLHAVQLVIGVTVQHWPPKELRQGLVQTARSRKREKRKQQLTPHHPDLHRTPVKALLNAAGMPTCFPSHNICAVIQKWCKFMLHVVSKNMRFFFSCHGASVLNSVYTQTATRHCARRSRRRKRGWARTPTSVICSSCSSNGLPSLLLKNVAMPTISSFLLTIGRDRTFLMTKPVSSTASFWKTGYVSHHSFAAIRVACANVAEHKREKKSCIPGKWSSHLQPHSSCCKSAGSRTILFTWTHCSFDCHVFL